MTLQTLKPKDYLVLLLLGFSSGLPFALTSTTLQAWLKAERVDLGLIGALSLVGLPYALKFLWAPFMDRYRLPFLGRRRGWILACQGTLVLAIGAMALARPGESLGGVAILAMVVAFASASQDIVIDAWRADVLPMSHLGTGNSLHTTAYRLAMLTSGAAALVLADRMPWRMVYGIMGLLMGLGMVGTFLAPSTDDWMEPPPSLREAVTAPLREFMGRPGFREVLGFIVLYKAGDTFVGAMATPFLMDTGFTLTQIGTVTKFFGLASTFGGMLIGANLMLRMDLRDALLRFGIIQGTVTAAFLAIALAGAKLHLLVAAVILENLGYGMGAAAFQAFMMAVCDRRYVSMQLALLSGFMALSRVLLGAPSGLLAKALGWKAYFALCILMAIPGLLMLRGYARWRFPRAHPPREPIAS